MSSLISEVKIWPINGHKSLKANASFVVANSFVVRCTVIAGSKGLFVQMPQEKYEKDGETKYVDKVFPLSKEARQEVNDTVISEYESQVSGSSSSSSSSAGDDNLPF